MLATKLFAPTLRETPADAEVISQQYMLRAGFIRKMAGGIYTYLPLAWRTLRKVEAIIREEMDAKGTQEILMPIIQPSEIWKESGRWSVYGDEMFRLADRHGREYCLGPTHEEMITTLVKNEVSSYRQLPLHLYQIQNKYRDEKRPRYGLMRGREFIMKDSYSFDVDDEAASVSYSDMYEAYSNIFTRCGLFFKAVEADSGAIGGNNTHEFMALAEAGEADVIHCQNCDYAANIEIVKPAPLLVEEEEMQTLELVETPGANTIIAVAEFLNKPLDKTIKAVVFKSETQVVLAIVRGDHEINEIALQHVVGSDAELTMAEEEDLVSVGLVAGYISPVGLKQSKELAIVVDETVMNTFNCVAGGNQKHTHYINVNPTRDFDAKEITVASIRLAMVSDPCPKCGGTLELKKGIEVGQVFKLGTKYSENFGATFLDKDGRPQPMVMGCYGIGVSRTVAAVIEQFHDDDGIIWPVAIAPYEAVVVPINSKDEALMAVAVKLYEELRQQGVDVILDDRKDRAGVKFKDADLIGYPLRLTISKNTLETQEVEIRIRKNGEEFHEALDQAATKVKEILSTL